ncbi:lipoxygenase family protein [Altericista sp. CCNU0014]|uniref:lipoxygenase family protein n=1 Tax=Altericista sp. CCNU0014 TaxID=3082949 RepID=UPI00384F70BB
MVTSSSEKSYEWELTPHYAPPHIKDLPKGQGFTIGKIVRFDSIVAKGVLGFIFGEFLYGLRRFRLGKLRFQMTADLGLAEVLKSISKWNRLEDFEYFYKPWTSFVRPKVADTWHTDLEFGQERLCGINPAFIRKCRPEDLQVGGNFPVTDELVRGLLSEGETLAAALAGDRLYLLDHQMLSNILTPELEDQLGKYFVSPLCLLHVNAKGRLLPIAIRLWQGDGFDDFDKNPIFTPNSPAQSWLTAKVAVSSAEIAYQGIVSHLLNTHLIVETFGVSTYRQFSPDHIIFQLLEPHFFNTFAINEMARGIFLGHNGFFDETGTLGYTGSNELLERAYCGTGRNYEGKPFLFYRTALPLDLETREVSNLQGYYYRDDALLIWDAIQTYVSDILKLRYKSSADLAGDSELQAWKQELVSPEFGRLQGLLPPEKADQITGPLTELEDLTAILTTLIFTATAQHSAVNFGQYEYAGWVPNMPFAIYHPYTDVSNRQPPTSELVTRFPDRLQTIKQMILVKALSMPTPQSSPSLLSMKNPFKDPEARKVFQAFQGDRLKQIEEQIAARNAAVELPYIRLLPSNIAQSIAI